MEKLRSRSNDVLGYQGLRIHEELAGTPVVTPPGGKRGWKCKRKGERFELSSAPEVAAAGSAALIHTRCRAVIWKLFRSPVFAAQSSVFDECREKEPQVEK